MRFRPLVLALLVCACSLAAVTTASAAPTWSPEFQLSNGDGNVFDQKAVTDGAGRTTVIWIEDGVLRARTRAPGGQFGAPADISPGDSVDQFDATTDAAGNVTVAYAISGGGLAVRTRPSGQTTWSAAQNITGAVIDEVSIDSNPAGVTALAWLDTDNVETAKRATPSATFSSFDTLSSNDPADVNIVVRADSGLAEAWTEDDGADYVVLAETAAATDSAFGSPPAQLSNSGVDSGDVSLLANARGDVLAYWDEFGADASVWFSSLGATDFNAADQVSDPGTDSAYPRAALDDYGNVAVAWVVPNFIFYGVQARAGQTGPDQYGPFRNLSAGGGSPYLSVAKDDDGTAFIGTISPDLDDLNSGIVRVSRQSGSDFSPLQAIGYARNLGFGGCGCGLSPNLPLSTDHHGGAVAAWPTTDNDSQTYLDASILADAGSAAPPPPAEALPEILSAKLTSLTFRAQSSGAMISKAKPKGTTLTIDASKAGTLQIDVQKYTTGRRATRASKCSAKARRGKGCTIWKTINSDEKPGVAGNNQFNVSGRAGGKKLQPGQYRFVISLKSGGRTSAPKTRTFKIVK